MRIAVVGAGNVATHLAAGLAQKCEVVQVCSRTAASAAALAGKIGCGACSDVALLADADAYLVSVSDDQIAAVLAAVPQRHRKKLWMHTSGSVGLTAFSGFNALNGVVYPLQTFSKSVPVCLPEVPFFVEGSSAEATEAIKGIASLLSPLVYEADSEKRMRMHIAAVFACNFTNHLFAIADSLLKEQGLPFSTLEPLIRETVRKASAVPPAEAQTGPASRGDMGIVEKHLRLLSGDEREIYELLSKSIINKHQHK